MAGLRKNKKEKEKEEIAEKGVRPLLGTEEKVETKKDFLTVSEFLDGVNVYLKSTRNFVVGEVTEFKQFDQWVSFSLKDKDDGSMLRCFLSIWTYRKIGIILEDGMQIKTGGFPRVYKPSGSFSFQVESIEPIGEGSLKKAYLLLVKKLESEGIFARKRLLPKFIKNIGVISSKDGVVIQDFRKNLKNLGFKINFFNSRVEGPEAVAGITNGIKFFNSKMPDMDVVVIMRGGGSLESMQAFNNEQVCREIFSSKIPVICGIGHDVDMPIACMVADQSASTPTATAYAVNKSWDDLLQGLPIMDKQIFSGFIHNFNALAQKIPSIKNRIISHFKFALDRNISEISSLTSRISSGFKQIFSEFDILSKKIAKDAMLAISEKISKILYKVSSIEKMIALADPERNLKLGYSIVFNKAGRVLKNISDAKMGEILITKLKDGEIESEVKSIKD